MNKASSGTTDGLPPDRLRSATFSILLGTFMGVLDGLIPNVALPAIAADLHSQPAAATGVGFVVSLARLKRDRQIQ